MKFAQNFSILYWIRKNQTDHSNFKIIYCRLTIDGKRTEISTGLSVDEKTFNPTTGFAKGNSQNAQLINARLDEFRSRLRHIYNQLCETENKVTVEMVRNKFAGSAEERKTIIDAMTWHNEMFQQKVKAGTRVPKSFVRFKTTVDNNSWFPTTGFWCVSTAGYQNKH